MTIVILNYQRQETLRRVLHCAQSQTYPHLDIIVVDNASTDRSIQLVSEQFPDVHLIQLPENIGCAARNHGVSVAKGEIVITLDNDVILTQSTAVQTVVECFAAYPLAACINFKILNATGELSHRDWCHPRDWQTFSEQAFCTAYVLEGASAFRRQVFDRIGGYWAPFFIGHEGHDLAYRLLGAGFDLIYSPQIQVTHLVSQTARPSSRIYYTFTRNAIWVSLRNHRPLAAIRALLKYMTLMAFSSVRAGHGRSYIHGLWDGMRGLPQVFATRSPLSADTYVKLRHIRRYEPSLWTKFKRHWRERPI